MLHRLVACAAPVALSTQMIGYTRLWLNVPDLLLVVGRWDKFGTAHDAMGTAETLEHAFSIPDIHTDQDEECSEEHADGDHILCDNQQV